MEMVGLQKSRPLPPGDLDEAVAQPVAQPAPAVEAAPVRRRVEEMYITFPSGAPLGVGLIQKDGKVVVDLVQPTSAAAAVPVGATIQEINGASCEGKGMKEVMAMIVDAKSAGEVTATFLVELAEAAPVRRRVEEMYITFPSGAPLGVGLIQKDGKVIVDLVQPTSAAAAVPINSPLKEINGTSCEGKGMKEVMAMIASAKSAGQVIATFLVESSAEDEEDEFTTKI